MKKLRTNKKFVLVASVALTLVMILAATFAWFSQKDEVENEFNTGGIPKDSVTIWEEFEKPEEWKPGQEVNKDVGVVNKGTMPVFVRATYHEALTKLIEEEKNGQKTGELKVVQADAIKTKEEMTDKFKVVPSVDYSKDNKWIEATEASEYKLATPKAGVKFYYQKDTVDVSATEKKEVVHVGAISEGQNGFVSAKFKVENKMISATDIKFNYYELPAKADTFDWTSPKGTIPTDYNKSALDDLIKFAYHTGNVTAQPTKDKWFYNKDDGYFYFAGAVKGGTITPLFLDNVSLDGSAGNTYQFMNYKLTVKAEGLQATMPAVDDTWKLEKTGELYKLLEAAAKEVEKK